MAHEAFIGTQSIIQITLRSIEYIRFPEFALKDQPISEDAKMRPGGAF
jgi:hypothetical protein